ncbi:MAG: hypothetical protein ACXWC8_12380, partial [Limisphaerales bacterium]
MSQHEAEISKPVATPITSSDASINRETQPKDSKRHRVARATPEPYEGSHESDVTAREEVIQNISEETPAGDRRRSLRP